jgi:dienelactone hydrolase
LDLARLPPGAVPYGNPGEWFGDVDTAASRLPAAAAGSGKAQHVSFNGALLVARPGQDGCAVVNEWLEARKVARPPLGEVPNLNIPVLGIYGGDDQRINEGVPALEAALKEHNKNYKFITYPGAGHAFFNDTGSRYNPQAAGEAWRELLAWFQTNLKG